MAKQNNVFFYLLAIIFAGLFVFHFGYNLSLSEKNYKGVAQGGVFDLRTWQAEDNKCVALHGEWEFYWNQLLTSKDINELKPTYQYISLPSIWNGVDGKPAIKPSYGYATHRLRIVVNEGGYYAIRIKELDCAYKLWVNGKDSIGSGIVGRNKAEERPNWQRKELLFYSDTNIIEVILQVSNYHHRKGGAEEPLVFGKQEDIYHYKMLQVSVAFFIIGILFIMALYHFVLFLFQKKDRGALIFSGLNLLLALFLSTVGEKVLLDLFPSMPWGILIRIEYLSFTLSVPVFIAFLKSIFPEDFSKRILNVFSAIGLVTVFFICFTSSTVFSYTMLYYQFVIVLASIYIFIKLIATMLRRRENAYWIFGGYLFFFLAIINDILYFNNFLETSFLSSYGLFVMVFPQAFVLAKYRSQSFDKIKKLSIELEQRKVNLEKQVAQRTQQIEQQKEELHQNNVNLKRLSEFKADMTGMIIHDLKNPLNSIVNSSQITNTYQFRNLVVDASKTMLNLVLNVLDLYKFEDSKLKLNKQEKLLSVILRKALLEVEYQEKKKNICLRVNVQSDFLLDVDSELITRVLINYLINAIQFSPSNKAIEIRATQQESQVFLHVIDEGVGIATQESKHVFEKFNANVQGAKNYHSSGIGLAFCKMAILAHGGEVGVVTSIGHGADFWFSLPFKQKLSTVKTYNHNYNSDFELQLTDKQKQLIAQQINLLKMTKLYNLTQINDILQEIESYEIEGLEAWLGKVRYAVEYCDESLYNETLSLI